MINEQPAPLRLQLGAVPHERLALPVDMPALLFLFTRHADRCQLAEVAIDIPAQPLA